MFLSERVGTIKLIITGRQVRFKGFGMIKEIKVFYFFLEVKTAKEENKNEGTDEKGEKRLNSRISDCSIEVDLRLLLSLQNLYF